ncbi:protein of unknown function [Hyphomicrobium sp. MC1]|nr:protein of unknown function [Hyphomicrobium sp. MC1]
MIALQFGRCQMTSGAAVFRNRNNHIALRKRQILRDFHARRTLCSLSRPVKSLMATVLDERLPHCGRILVPVAKR